MASVRSKGNRTTEAALGRLLRAAGLYGYRKQWRVAGRPDFAWPGIGVAVFVDGCFWHGCSCKHLPKSNQDFWRSKIENNMRRDRRVAAGLRRAGWTVLRIRECAVGYPSTLKRIAAAVAGRRAAKQTS
jgi:DNA mismatch endonuclease (patch repair protein)